MKKSFCQNEGKCGYNFFKDNKIFMYILCIYQKHIILSLFKIGTLNFIMYILTNLTHAFYNLISMNIFFTKRSLFFLITLKKQPKTKKLLKQKDNQKQPFSDVFQNGCSLKFPNMQRNTPVLQSFRNKLVGLQLY